MNFGESLARDARWEDAEIAFERARTIIESTMGIDHPLMYSIDAGMCTVLQGREKYQEAAELCGRVLEHYAENPPSPMWESRVNFIMAEVLSHLDRIPEARQRAERARRAIAEEDPKKARSISEWIETLD